MNLSKDKILGTLIALTLVSLPLYTVRCSNFSFCRYPIPFTLLEVLVLITFGYWFFLQIKTSNLKQKLLELQNNTPRIIQLFILIFLISGLIGSFISPDIRAGLGIYKAYFLEGFLLSLVVFDYLLVTKNYSLVVWALIGAGLWISLFAILNQFFSYNPGNPAEFIERGRASAVYSTSNAVGLLLGPIMLLLFGYTLALKQIKNSKLNENKLAIISLIILLLGLLASGSRGAFLGVFAGFIFFFSFLLYQKTAKQLKEFVNKLIRIFLVGFFSSILLFFVNINYFANNSPKLPFNLQESFESRLCLWDGAGEIIKKKPLTGSGLGGFQTVHDQLRTCSTENSIYPHNIFLNFWTEVGIFGLISFFGLSLYLFFKLLEQKNIDYLNLGLASFLVVVLVHGLIDVPFFKNDLSAVFWVVVAICLARTKNQRTYS